MNAIEKLREKLDRHPHIGYSFEGDSLTVHKTSDTGFSVTFTIDSGEFTVHAGDFHWHFDTDEEAMDFFGFCLSRECRLREIRRFNVPFKWTIDALEGDEWIHAFETATICYIFVFFGRKTETIYQNDFI